jgi:glyoxylase-like metal-dependent hydrolase (beta-lactamase superfamily II)
MPRVLLAFGFAALVFAGTAPAHAQAQQPSAPPTAQPEPPPAAQPARPPFATTKVEGTDNVYIYRYQNHQAMFIVTPEGVIATDPIGLGRPQAVTTYIDEIKKVTQAPIRYVVYSHHHYDHIAGGRPFKELGATFIAHRRAKERIADLKQTDIVVLPDETVDDKRTISLGGTELDLIYVGRNHSDSSLVMRLPREKLLFAVDFIPIQSVSLRAFGDSYPLEWEQSLKNVLGLDWERLIPGHPYIGRLGTKQDVQDLLSYMQDLSAEVKKAAEAGKCYEQAEKEVRLPKYASWMGYEQGITKNIERYCQLWGRGVN